MPHRPNIFLIISHDPAQHLGRYGIAAVQSPRTEGLATQSARFSRSYRAQTQCGPSRSSIYTGRYPHGNKRFTRCL